MKTVSIEPIADGWAVRSELADNAMIFRSGAMAEDAAVRLAKAICESGAAIRIQVCLRDGTSKVRECY